MLKAVTGAGLILVGLGVPFSHAGYDHAHAYRHTNIAVFFETSYRGTVHSSWTMGCAIGGAGGAIAPPDFYLVGQPILYAPPDF